MYLSPLIIDFHVHPWTREFASRNNYFASILRLNGLTVKDLPPDTEELAHRISSSGVQKAVFLAQYADHRLNPGLKNFFFTSRDVAKIADRHSFVIPFGSINPNDGLDALVNLKKDIAELGLKGVCIFTSATSVYPSNKIMYLLYDLCIENSIPVIFHPAALDILHCSIKYDDPVHLDEIAKDFPELKIIIGHAGWPWTETAVAVAMRNDNVYIDIQPLEKDKQHAALMHFIKRTHGKRVLFGSNYPLLADYKPKHIESYFKKELGSAVAEDILHNNAEELLSK